MLLHYSVLFLHAHSLAFPTYKMKDPLVSISVKLFPILTVAAHTERIWKCYSKQLFFRFAFTYSLLFLNHFQNSRFYFRHVVQIVWGGGGGFLLRIGGMVSRWRWCRIDVGTFRRKVSERGTTFRWSSGRWCGSRSVVISFVFISTKV